MTFVTFWPPFVLEVVIAVVNLIFARPWALGRHHERLDDEVKEVLSDGVIDAAYLVPEDDDLSPSVGAFGHQF